MQEKVLIALDDGIRHFHLNFAAQSDGQESDVSGRLFALRVVEALAVLKQRHLHYLRDALVFSLRAKPNQIIGSLELLWYLQAAGFHACLWLLDVTNSTPRDITNVWPELDQAVKGNLVDVLGLFGGGHTEFSAASSPDYARPAVQALDLYIGANFNVRQWVHITKQLQAGVTVMTCKPFGPQASMVNDAKILAIAKETGMDPAMLLMKWAEGLGYLSIVPFLRASASPDQGFIGEDTPFVLNGTRRSFVKEYAAGAKSDIVLQHIKKRFPQNSLDHVRYQSSSGDREQLSPRYSQSPPGAAKKPAPKKRNSLTGTSPSGSPPKSASDSPQRPTQKIGEGQGQGQVRRPSANSETPTKPRPVVSPATPQAKPPPKVGSPGSHRAPIDGISSARKDSSVGKGRTPLASITRTPPSAPPTKQISSGSNSVARSYSPPGSAGRRTGSGALKQRVESQPRPTVSNPSTLTKQRKPSPDESLRACGSASRIPKTGTQIQAENTDMDGGTIASRQRQLAKREVELMLKQVQLEQKRTDPGVFKVESATERILLFM
jgi:hypothetical protein